MIALMDVTKLAQNIKILTECEVNETNFRKFKSKGFLTNCIRKYEGDTAFIQIYLW